MTGTSRTVAVVKGQLSKFSGIISGDLSKAKQRLVRETIYGIQAAKDDKLSNITRSLNESLPLIKTEDRLSRNLDDRDFKKRIPKNRRLLHICGLVFGGHRPLQWAQKMIPVTANQLDVRLPPKMSLFQRSQATQSLCGRLMANRGQQIQDILRSIR